MKTAVLRFRDPFGAYGQRTTIILGSLKRRSGLPISVNWTFFARC